MSVGISGRMSRIAYARTSSWNCAASVTQQILVSGTGGLDDQPELVEDDSFVQDYIGAAEVGDHKAIAANLSMQLRYEQGCDVFLAGALGSPATPASISGQGANSLVAYSHVVDMAPSAWAMFTAATDMVNYVEEVRSFKIGGFSIKNGAGGRMTVDFPIVGDLTNYTSTTNTNSTVRGATVSTPGNRAFRKYLRMRMNLQSAGSLVASDEVMVAKEIAVAAQRTLAQDYVTDSDSIMEPDDDGFLVGTLDVTYARMTSVSANSLATAFQAGTVFKGDLFWQGTLINSTTKRSILMEMPALQVSEYKAEITGNGQVRPTVKFLLRRADANPTGMAFTNPVRVTIVNARSTNLLA